MSLRPPVIAVAAALLVAVAGGFFWGRYTAPTKTIEKTRTVEVVKEVAAKEKETAHVEAQSATRRDATRRVVRTIKHRDGTVETTTTDQTVRSSEAAAKRESKTREVEVRYVDRTVEVQKLVVKETEKAAWGIGARAGVRGGFGDFVYGAEVSRRLVGPLWAGAWADTSKAAGLNVRWEF